MAQFTSVLASFKKGVSGHNRVRGPSPDGCADPSTLGLFREDDNDSKNRQSGP